MVIQEVSFKSIWSSRRRRSSPFSSFPSSLLTVFGKLLSVCPLRTAKIPIHDRLHTMENPAKEVTIEDFKRLEMRAGTIVEVSRVPRTETLFKVVVSLGEHGRKQMITSLVGFSGAGARMN